MKKTKNYLYTILMVLACGVLVTSCKDDFDEEQFLINQQERADQLAAEEAAEEEAMTAENAAAVASAANVTYTVSLHSDNVPVPGATVTLTNQSGGGTVSATSDANGNAAFVDIDLGGYTVAISSADHLDSSYLVDFGSVQNGVHYEWVNDTVVVLEQSEASIIELLESNGLQTATIKGNVEIETDLTNDTPEVPQGITIRANLDNFNGLAEHTNNSFNGSNNASSFYITGSFSLTEGDIGSADVDPTTGAYSMTVPAQEDGTDIDLLIPLVEADQTLAFSTVDGQDLGVQVGTQPAVFGSDITATATPSVSGAVATFPAPADPGRGFTIGNFMPMHRGISNGTIDDFPIESDLANIRYRGTEGSDDYQLSPTVTVGAPDQTSESNMSATITANMDWTFESFEITNGGLYDPNDVVFFTLEIDDDTDPGNGFITQIQAFTSLVADAMGVLPTGEVNNFAPLNFNTTEVVAQFRISTFTIGNEQTIPTFDNIVRNGEVAGFTTTNGDGYTSIPSIDITGGGATTQATLEITDMAFQYSFDLDNSGISQGYVVLPTVEYEYQSAPGVITSSNSVQVYRTDTDGFVFDTSQGTLSSFVMVSNGQLAYDNDLAFDTSNIDGGRTTAFSYVVPSAIITEPTHEQAEATVNINNTTGEVTGLTVSNLGTGYDAEFGVSIDLTSTALAGSGASFELTDFTTNAQTGEVSWGGTRLLLSGGSDYTGNINIASEAFAGSTSLTVKNGETKIVNVNYGTGDRVADVE